MGQTGKIKEEGTEATEAKSNIQRPTSKLYTRIWSELEVGCSAFDVGRS